MSLAHSDVSITHPVAPSYLSQAVTVSGSAASTRESLKRSKYAQRIERGAEFVPLVLESFGRLGESVSSFLQQTFKIHRARRGRFSASSGLYSFAQFALCQLSCALQKGNMLCLAEGV